MEGSYAELFREDERIFAFTRESDAGRAVILINFSTEPAEYDPACVEDAAQLLGTHGQSEKGVLAPLEAVIFEAPLPS